MGKDLHNDSRSVHAPAPCSALSCGRDRPCRLQCIIWAEIPAGDDQDLSLRFHEDSIEISLMHVSKKLKR